MALIEPIARKQPRPLSWKDIDADERRHDDELPAVVSAEDDDITDVAPLAPDFLRHHPDAVELDAEATARRARLIAREPGWPDNAAPSGRMLAAMSILVILAVVALIGVTFTA